MESREESLFLKDYFNIIIKRKGIIFLVIMFFIITASMINIFTKPVFQATTTILIFPWGIQQSIFGGIGSSSIFGGADEIETHIQMIKSYNVAQGVAEKIPPDFIKKTANNNKNGVKNNNGILNFFNRIFLKLIQSENVEVKEENYKDEHFEEPHLNDVIVKKIRNSIIVNSIKNTNMIEISCETQNAELSAEIANITASVFIEKALIINRSNISKGKIFIEEQLVEKEKELIDMEEELQFIKSSKEFEDKDNRLANLERMIRVSENVYILLLEKYQEAKINEVMEFGGITIIDKALVPTEPVKPKKLSNLIVGGILGIMLSMVIAFFLEYIDHTIRNVKDIERHLELPVIGVIPCQGNHKKEIKVKRFFKENDK